MKPEGKNEGSWRGRKATVEGGETQRRIRLYDDDYYSFFLPALER